MPDRTRQNRNIVAGDQAGRDINKTYLSRGPSPLRHLLDRLQEGTEESEEIQGYVEALEHVVESPDPSDRRDLADKLRLAGREGEFSAARRSKEFFWKTLQRNQLSPVARGLFASLMGHAIFEFRAKVRPLILSGAIPGDIDTAVAEHVIRPLMDMLEENPLDLTPEHLQGMVYFLTGNCHLDWS